VELPCVGQRPVRMSHKYRLVQFPGDAASFFVGDVLFDCIRWTLSFCVGTAVRRKSQTTMTEVSIESIVLVELHWRWSVRVCIVVVCS
jgi:hypothetical protein